MLSQGKPWNRLAVSLVASTANTIRTWRSKVCDSEVILVVKTDGIGDYLLADPFLRELRKSKPQAKIVAVVRRESAILASTSPYIDKVISYPEPWRLPGGRFLLAIWMGLEVQYRFQPQIAYVPRWDIDHNYAGVVACLSGAKVRIGFSEHVSVEKRAANKYFDRLYSKAVCYSVPSHESVLNMQLLTESGVIPESNEIRLDYLLEDGTQTQKQHICVVGVSAGHASRMWSWDKTRKLIDSLITTTDLNVILVGTANHSELAKRILKDYPRGRVTNLVGRTDLKGVALWLKQSRFYFGPDTSLVHLASGLRVPSIVISPYAKDGPPMHANSPVRFGPIAGGAVLQPEQSIYPCTTTCSQQMPHCIDQVTTENVMRTLRSLGLLP